jgi:hypothetical protein
MLLTCQFNKDKRAVDEARLLFEEAYARMGKSDVLAATRTAGSQKEPAKPAGGASGGEGGGGSKSVEAMLAAEVAELREPRPALFPWHATGVPNTIFVIFPRGEGEPAACRGARAGGRASTRAEPPPASGTQPCQTPGARHSPPPRPPLRARRLPPSNQARRRPLTSPPTSRRTSRRQSSCRRAS